MKTIKYLLKTNTGAGAIEYTLAVTALVAIIGWVLIGPPASAYRQSVSNIFSRINTLIDTSEVDKGLAGHPAN